MVTTLSEAIARVVQVMLAMLYVLYATAWAQHITDNTIITMTTRFTIQVPTWYNLAQYCPAQYCWQGLHSTHFELGFVSRVIVSGFVVYLSPIPRYKRFYEKNRIKIKIKLQSIVRPLNALKHDMWRLISDLLWVGVIANIWRIGGIAGADRELKLWQQLNSQSRNC